MFVTSSDRLNLIRTALTAKLQGETDFSAAGIAMYTSDASNYRQVPYGVVYPKSREDIKTIVSLCHEHQVPMLMRGAGTSQNGQTVNEAIVVDYSHHLNKVLEIDVKNRTATVEPGIVCDSLNAAAAEYGLTFGPDPATHSRCTVGGMVGNNSCGPRSMLAGKTVENVLELEVLTCDGTSFTVGPTTDTELAEIIAKNDQRGQLYKELQSIRDHYADLIRQRFPTIKRRVSGYNLDQLLPENNFNVARALVGSEGTCVTVLQAKVALIEKPQYKRLFVLGFQDIFAAGDLVPGVMPFAPIAMEGLDWNIIGGLNDRGLRQKEVSLLPQGRAWLLIELAATEASELETLSLSFQDAMQSQPTVVSLKTVTNSKEVSDIWSIREQGASATALALQPGDPDPVVGWEDTAVDPTQLGDYLRELYALVYKYNYTTSLYGHFGDGCIHARMTFDTRSKEGVAKWRRFSKEIAELVVKYKGSLSGEHGDGQSKAEFLPIMYGEELMDAFRRFKKAWDPDRLMNPGKLIDAYRMDENLRFSPQYSTPSYESTLHFTEDTGGFGRSSERCIGMGKCRTLTGAMCPSYQATGEERFSTRGRAHLLHELLRGEVIPAGFADKNIAESLEHCLSCKACKSQCPTQVDIAAYKAEFMHEHFKLVKRPLHQKVFAHAGRMLPAMTRFPMLVNFIQSGFSGRLLKSVLNVREDKSLPQLADISFTSWAKNNYNSKDNHFLQFGVQSNPPVVLWIDSVNNAYRPQILQSTIELLTRCSFSVLVAKSNFCCGRPLYEHGYLLEAKMHLQNILQLFYPQLPDNTDVIVAEPSCLSVFKDELHRQFPANPQAADLSNRTKTIAEFLQKHKLEPQRTLPQGIMHLHCHAKNTINAERELMHKCFDQLSEPEASCCGMAGVFGIKKSTAATGDKLYQRSLKQSIDAKHPDTRIISDGYSCRKQIEDHSAHKVWHPVEILAECL